MKYLLALSFALSGCAGPVGITQHDPIRYGVVRVTVSVADPQSVVTQALAIADAFGPDFTASNNQPHVTIIAENSPMVAPSDPCQRYLTYNVDAKTIAVDTACLTAEPGIREAVSQGIARMLGRIVGMQPICRVGQNYQGCSDTVRGDALMNSSPFSNFTSVATPTNGTFRESYYAPRAVTELDLQEYRTHGQRLP